MKNISKILFIRVCEINCILAYDSVRYDVHHDEVFSEAATVTNLQQEQGVSVVHCASLCSRLNECCSTSYKMDGGVCQLNSHCCPPTVTSNGGKVLVRDPTIGPANRRDCSDLMPGTCSGVYPIVLSDKRGIFVRCEMETDDEQWTVIQRRFNGSVSFYRDWDAYKWGFGDINGEFWLGNDNIHGILSGNTKAYKLRFDLVDFNDDTAYAEYSEFYVDSEATDYTITINGYSGTAGDSMKDSYWDSLTGMKFSTSDRDNDLSPEHSGSILKQAGFWFRVGSRCNVNGIYIQEAILHSMHWQTWHGNDGLKETRMMIKPIL